MSLVSEIIKDAYRETNLVAISQYPSLDEQTEALRLLNRFVRSVFGNEAGTKLQEFSNSNLVDLDYTPLNSRIVFTSLNPLSLKLSPTPQDGSRFAVIDSGTNFGTNNVVINANGRKIEGATSVTLNTDGLQREWFYRADLGLWAPLSTLVFTDSLPFPSEFDDMFVIGLAMRLNSRNGVQLDNQSMATYRRLRNVFTSRYKPDIEIFSEPALTRLSRVSPTRGFTFK